MLIKAYKQMKNAAGYSAEGLMFMLRNEFAARLEIYIFVTTMVIFALLKVPFTSFMIAVILMLTLMAMESLNTAIEVMIDHISPEISPVGKHAKDLGSFSVMCLLFVNLIYGFYVILTSNFVQGLIT
ncbi:MAG: diacylglycerol kinase [Maricaulaceae bacterium]